MGDAAPVSRWAQRKQQREQMYATSSDAIQGVFRKKQAAPKNMVCQKCLLVGHWTYECKGKAAYKMRVSSTKILENPDLKPKFHLDLPPGEGEDKKGGAAPNAKGKVGKKRRREDSSSSSGSSSSSSSGSSSESDSDSSSGSSSSSSSNSSTGTGSSSSGSSSDGSSGSSSDSSSDSNSDSSSSDSSSSESDSESDSDSSSSSSSSDSSSSSEDRRTRKRRRSAGGSNGVTRKKSSTR